MRSDKLKGSLLLILAAFFLAIYSALTLAAKADIYSSLMTFYTCFFGFLFLLVPAVQSKFKNLKTHDILAVLIRGVIGGLSLLCFVIASRLVNLLDAIVLYNTTPIILPIIALFYTRVKIPAMLWIPIIIGFFGIVLIVQPDSELFSNPGILIALLSGILFSFALIAAGKLAKGGMCISGIVFYRYFFATLVSLPFAIYHYEDFNSIGLLYAFIGAITLTIASFSMGYAYKFATPSEIGPYWYFSILFSGLFGYLIFDQYLDLWKLVGMIIVIGAGISTFYINKTKPKVLKH